MASPVLTKDQVFVVARRVTEILKGSGLPHYFIGGVASALWGASRTPNDVDLVVAQPPVSNPYASMYAELYVSQPSRGISLQGIKALLAHHDKRFFARQSTNPDNNCPVLWFALAPGEECKVDIMFPPTLNVPFIAEDRILWGDGLPVAPLLVHLLLKVQAWEHHRTSPLAVFQAKEPVDVADICELLKIGKRDVDFGLDQEKWGAWPSQFMAKVRNFVWVYPESRGAWKDVGLEFDMVIYKRGVAYEP